MALFQFWLMVQFTTYYDEQICSYSFKPEIVCPMKKHITFINEHKRQKIKKI